MSYQTSEEAEDALLTASARYLRTDHAREAIAKIRSDAKAEGLQEAATIVASEETLQWDMAKQHLTGAQIVAQRLFILKKIILNRVKENGMAERQADGELLEELQDALSQPIPIHPDHDPSILPFIIKGPNRGDDNA